MQEPELREHFWDQLHPKTGRFRPIYYQKSKPWQISSETFIDQTEPNDLQFLDWVGGTYHFDAVIFDGLCDKEIQESEFTVRLTLALDFTKKDSYIQWTIDTRAPQTHKQAAYPGVHRGDLTVWNSSGINTHCRVQWQTFVLCRYAEITTPYRGSDREDIAAVSMISSPKRAHSDAPLRAGHREK